MDKPTLRRLIRERKQQYTAAQLATLSQSATSALERHPLFASARTILLYHSLPDEVGTHALIERTARRCRVLLPTVVGDELQLHEYTPSTPLATGAYGISESQGQRFTHLHTIDVAVVPAMAYDPQGHRLGRGRGYYDRLLPHLRCPLLGLAFSFQILPSIPTEPHDIPVTAVVTDQSTPAQ